jgi:hypothetical protein
VEAGTKRQNISLKLANKNKRSKVINVKINCEAKSTKSRS